MSNTATLEEKKALLAKLQAEIAQEMAQARAGELEKVRAVVAEYNFTAEEIFSAKAPKKGTGAKVAPKYKNPVTGETWTGRGKAPKWMQDVPADQRVKYEIAPAAAN